MQFKAILLLAVFLFSALELNSQSDVFAKTRIFLQEGKWEKVVELIDKDIEKSSSQDKELMLFQKAFAYFQMDKLSQSEEIFNELKVRNKLLTEYVLFYLGQIYLGKKDNSRAKEIFSAVLEGKPNVRLKNETMLFLSRIQTEEKNYKASHDLLEKLERATRGTEQHPFILLDLAAIEDQLNLTSKKCSRLIKLYSQYPQFERISTWSYNLSLNPVNNKESKCAWEIDDFKKRVRNSLWAGQEKKALEEILSFKKDFQGKYDFDADKILAMYHAQEGDLDKAYGILKKYLVEKERDFEFLNQLAPIAARSGDLNTAVSLYYKGYQMQKRSTKGVQALFQAAFMSYQLRDYDWATRKFKEFIKISKNEKLKKESQWYLAWMKYLRGEYHHSFNDFKKLASIKNTKQYRSLSKERLNYWMGMSLYREGKLEKSKVFFERLAADKNKGYYSVAASKRLEKLNVEQKAVGKVLNTKEGDGSSNFVSHFRKGFQSRMTAAIKESPIEEEVVVEAQEPEEETDPLEISEKSDEKVADGDESPFKTPELMDKFDKSRALMVMGMEYWSKWELYEIEKRTKNKDYLKVLLGEYAQVGQYHRMSHISQVYFRNQKSRLGIEHGRGLWEYSFPKAYLSLVDRYSKEFEVPRELVWSIMKAESQYKKEAISPVGALGLMQVMPYTGNRIAEILGDKNFTPKQLLDPDSAIKIGTKYLQRLNKKFNQTIPLVAASYNAGPHRVKNWLQQFGGLETDEFIEHIPFLETRNYVKKVIANSYIYSELYNDRVEKKSRDLVPYLAEKIPFSYTDRAPTRETWEEI
ncbi:MAG: transglycosylase SLT domain-containing protein [Bdellovibrionaceae bacterium]|nr:transglycosylase SLT domain-containing protein [Pseudobdellovibrionaceae bacterium]